MQFLHIEFWESKISKIHLDAPSVLVLGLSFCLVITVILGFGLYLWVLWTSGDQVMMMMM